MTKLLKKWDYSSWWRLCLELVGSVKYILPTFFFIIVIKFLVKFSKWWNLKFPNNYKFKHSERYFGILFLYSFVNVKHSDELSSWEPKRRKCSAQKWAKVDGKTKGEKTLSTFTKTDNMTIFKNLFFFFLPSEGQIKIHIRRKDNM